jgi:hypothetical protein
MACNIFLKELIFFCAQFFYLFLFKFPVETVKLFIILFPLLYTKMSSIQEDVYLVKIQ